jgi:fructose-6-phosphate aldolase 2
VLDFWRGIYLQYARRVYGIDKNRIVFSSLISRNYGDNLKPISEMLHEMKPDAEIIWMFRNIKAKRELVPDYVKMCDPITREGLRATAICKDKGIGVTMTAIFTPTQALMAAMAGADFVAPYVNRLDNIIADGTGVVAEIVEEFQKHGLFTKVLAASFKNAEQVHRCALCGCHSVTVPADILRSLITLPMTDNAIAGFERDWAGVYGNKTILEL